MHKIFSTYFLRVKRSVDQLVATNQSDLLYLEQSLGKISPEGVLPSFSLSDKEAKLREVTTGLEEFKTFGKVSLFFSFPLFTFPGAGLGKQRKI